MAHERGTATSQDDLVSKLLTFAVTNGWTQDRLDTTNNQAALHKDNIYVQFAWDGTHIGVYQSLAFDGAGTDAGDHTDDSGNGSLDAIGRSINDIGNGPYTSYDFFAGTEGGSDYLYMVLEYTPGFYRHFGAGEIMKIGDWTGGEFACCTTWSQISADIGQPLDSAHNVMLDGVNNSNLTGGTMHVEGLIDMTASQKWGVPVDSGSAGTDSSAETRVKLIGGFRTGPYLNAMAWMPSSLQQGFVPTILVPIWHVRTATTPDQIQLLGHLPGCRVVNMSGFDPAATFDIGGNTWQIFPFTHRGLPSGTIEKSAHGGIAYKR